jgi:type I restriction enzyme R subunit
MWCRRLRTTKALCLMATDAGSDGLGGNTSTSGGNTKDPAGVYGDGAGENGSENTGGGGGTDKPRKYEIGGRVTVSIARERIQYLDANGKLVTESLRDFTRINLAKKYDSLDAFL